MNSNALYNPKRLNPEKGIEFNTDAPYGFTDITRKERVEAYERVQELMRKTREDLSKAILA